MNVYIADTHLYHENIIRLCERPYGSVREMDEALILAMLAAEEDGATIYHLGDLAFKPAHVHEQYGGLRDPARHTLVAGNHDRVTSKQPDVIEAYRAFAGHVVGTEATWRTNAVTIGDDLDGEPVQVLLSHAPQSCLGDADFNLYGHFHNNYARNPERFATEYPWLARSARHFNVSVEMIDYRPISLADLIRRRDLGEALL